MSNITCEVKKKIAELSKSEKGYTKELNLISWNGNAAKLDLREWCPDHEKCGKGATFTEEEGRALLDALAEYFHEKD